MPIVKSADAPQFDLPGVKFTALAAPSRGSSENAAWRISLAAHTPGAPHQLTREEIFVAISGSAEAAIGPERFDVAAGDAIVVPAFTDFALSNKGDVPYLTFGTKENRYGIDGTMISTGEIDAKDMKIGKDGSFEIIISQKKQGDNWLPSTAGSTGLIIRQTFTDKTKERPGTFNIEAINAPATPNPITQEDLTRALNHTAAWVTGTAKTFADWSAMFMEHPNQILARDQKFFQRGGGDPNIFYGFAYFTLKDDEAWVIESEVPECRLWNFQLCNWWMESLDYRTIDNVWTNQTKAKLEKDGTLKIVVAKKDPGLGGNWLDSTSHTNGVALLRWVGAKNHPVPKCSVVKIK